MAVVVSPTEDSSLRPEVNFTYLQQYVESAMIYRFILIGFGGYVTFGVTMIGIPGNMVCCMVFHRQGLRDRMNLCLFSLAFVDLVYVTYALVWSSTVLMAYYRLFEFNEEKYMTCMRANLGITYGLRATSGLYSMVIAVERCVCVLFPLRASSLLRTRTMAALLLVLALFPQLGFSPLPIKYQVGQVVTPVGVEWQLIPSQLWHQHKDYIDAILYMFMSVTVPLLTFISVSLATFITVIKLRAAMSWREKATSTIDHSHVQQTGLTKMLVLTSCVYIITMVPFVSLIVAHLIIPEFSTNGRLVNIYLALYTLANGFPFINSAVVVFIYYNRSSRFRSEIRILFSYIKNRKRVDKV
ncbi:uncharacterized protein LOC112566175 [Pomacea canaliculata]|uniref:uncharacterized protein LOC112566175 n=1 Tax=Pomacea canaliculata TaxID=400727 RepID=UPI000D72B95A|nr:uncharacterized protein LOC112566175 [Pomacea canaliculata]